MLVFKKKTTVEISTVREEEENHTLMWSNTPSVNSPHYICLNCMIKHLAITFLTCHMPLIETLKDDYAWHIKTGVKKSWCSLLDYLCRALATAWDQKFSTNTYVLWIITG